MELNIELYYVPSKEQLANLLTKSLAKGTFNLLKNQLNISTELSGSVGK